VLLWGLRSGGGFIGAEVAWEVGLVHVRLLLWVWAIWFRGKVGREYVEPDKSHDGGGTEGGKDNGKAKEQESGPLSTPKAPTYEKVGTMKLSFYTMWWVYWLNAHDNGMITEEDGIPSHVCQHTASKAEACQCKGTTSGTLGIPFVYSITLDSWSRYLP
jgi:hypothetical protein